MADAFQPKFVDLVRNTMTTTGTGDFTLGAAVPGYTSFNAALQVGDTFYYSAIGLDRPLEREVGRGTLLAGGIVKRDPIGATKTNFSNGVKSIALIAAAEWYAQIQAGPGAPNRNALAGFSRGQASLLCEAGREGLFVWDGANHSSHVAADPAQGIYVAAASDPSGTSGAWVRKFSGAVNVRWFGAIGDGQANDGPAFVAALALLKSTAGNLSANGFYKSSSKLLVPAGHYYLGSTTLDVTHTLIIEGEGSGRINAAPASQLRWADGVSGIRVQNIDTSGDATIDSATHLGAGVLTVSGLKLLGGFNGITEGDHHAIDAKAPISLDDVWIDAWPGEGVNGVASIAANQRNFSVSSIARTRISQCRIGLNVRGNDANVVSAYSVELIANRQAGYVDDSGIGSNTLIGVHASTNGVGYAGILVPTQCSYSGKRYAVKWGQESWCSANAPSGTTSDNSGWLYIEPGVASSGAGIPAWVGGTAFRAGGDYIVANNVTKTCLVNCYSEAGAFNQFAWGTLVLHGAIGDQYRRGGAALSAYEQRLDIGSDSRVYGNFSSYGATCVLGPQSGAAAADLIKYLDNTNFFSHTYGRHSPTGTLLGGVTFGYTVGNIYWSSQGSGGSHVFFTGAFGAETQVASITNTGLSVAGAITSSGGGMGYGTGAGGAVVQATSKSTGVTLNKLCGRITTSGAALAAGAGVSFTVTDSQVSATDAIHLVLASGNASAGSYSYQVDSVAAGAFSIFIKNISAASLAEALVFNFSVHKAVAA